MSHADNSKNELTMAEFYGLAKTPHEKALQHLYAIKMVLNLGAYHVGGICDHINGIQRILLENENTVVINDE